MQKDDCVIAAHPDFSYSYCPGKVTAVSKGQIGVRFYDGREAKLERREIHPVTSEQHRRTGDYITSRTKLWIGHPVVTRNNKTGLFALGTLALLQICCKLSIFSLSTPFYRMDWFILIKTCCVQIINNNKNKKIIGKRRKTVTILLLSITLAE